MPRYRLVKGWLALAMASIVATPVFAQEAPSGDHYAGRPSDTGYGGTIVDATGNLPASIPLTLPPAHGGIPIPLQISYGARGVGAAGLGWDIPLSFLRQSTTFAHRRPDERPNTLPTPQQRTTLSLLGQTADLLPQGNIWVARVGTLELTVRHDTENWLAYDGQGRTYTFEPVPSLEAQGLWLLKSITTSSGLALVLTYRIVDWPIDGGVGQAIDLIRIDYNTPLDASAEFNCAKNEIALSYGNASTSPIAMSMLDNKVLVRKQTLTQIDITGRADCASPQERLRRYQFQYAPDADTGLPRLTTVSMLGRQGTPEESIALPIASYSYGSATTNGLLHYNQNQIIPLPAGALNNQISGTDKDSSVNAPESGDRYAMWQTLTDFTGDGRPDFVFKKNNQLWIAKGLPAPGGTTTFGVGFQALGPLSDSTFSNGAVSTQTSTEARFQYAAANRNTTDVWRQEIDVNGDGRVDIIDAAEEPDHWVIYLNTPGGPTGVQWERRSFSVKELRAALVSSGHTINGDYVPLSRRATGTNIRSWECWRWENGQWNWYSDGFSNHRCQGVEGQVLQRGPERTFVEWELVDLNGDGYPDFVFDSDPVDFQITPPSSTPTPVEGATSDGEGWQPFAPKQTNRIRAAYNVLGIRFDTDAEAFALSVDLFAQSSDQGISQWLCPGPGPFGPCDQSIQSQITGFADVNGDGLLDRVVGSRAYLGMYAGTAIPFSSVYITLPGPLATQHSTHDQQCGPGGAGKPTAEQTQGLRDLTGDGIPDYYDNGRVWIGTGTGFQQPIGIESTGAFFRFSHETETCNGDLSNTDGGLYDINGDGKPEVVGLVGNTLWISELVGPDGPGAPASGRLTGIDNGYGAKSTVTYISAKEFVDNLLPFPEIVVGSVSTAGTLGLGGGLDGFSYAYGRGFLVYDTALDRWAFPGYNRQVQFQLFKGPPGDKFRPGNEPEGLATITDTWPQELFVPSMTKQQRWLRNQRVGRTSDIFYTRAIIDPNPWSLLDITSTDSRLIGGHHYDYDAKLYEIPQQQAENVVNCFDMVRPYDYNSTITTIGPETLDVCRAHGFAFQVSDSSWRGDAAPPADQNVQTLVKTLSVDDFGRPLDVYYANDTFRADDDYCVENTYSTPTAPFPRVLSALFSRRISVCGRSGSSNTVASESWIYDGRTDGTVTDGHITSHNVDRRATDTGSILNTIHSFDATYDSNGNISTVQTRRDGATRTTTFTYDGFGIVPIKTAVDATGVPSTTMLFSYDPISLDPVGSTEANNTQRGTDYDGFGRPVRSTITLAGGSIGVLSTAGYLGFAGGDPAGRRVTVTNFTDPVAPANVATAIGRSGTDYLDELGRRRRTELTLGADYSNQTLVVGDRIYDAMGRVAFVADPFTGTQAITNSYGTSYYFSDTGELSCVIRAQGYPLPLQPITDIAAERYPGCLARSYADHVDTLDLIDASSLEPGSPQSGVVTRTARTAIGRTIERSTLQAGVRIEDATFSYDTLGHKISMTRYLEPATQTGPVTWSSKFDSLGQILQLSDPTAPTRFYSYSDWNEPTTAAWTDATTSHIQKRSYDSLGRLTQKQEIDNGAVDAGTVMTYAYDAPVNASPLVNLAVMAGQMAQATSPTGSVAFGYDQFGRVNAHVFTDAQGTVYVETAERHADGGLAALRFRLPDDNYAIEQAAYGYDSAGRLKTIDFNDPISSQHLYSAQGIDILGRVTAATYGKSISLNANYAPSGRQYLQNLLIKSPLGSRQLTYGQYDAMGRELARQQSDGGVQNPSSNTTLSYDALGRLSGATQSAGAEQPFNWAFGYNALGNVETLNDTSGATDVTLTYQTIDRDRVCRITYGKEPDSRGHGPPRPVCNVVHDAEGNIISEPIPSGSRQFTYFSSGDVRTITHGSDQASFTYDPFNHLQNLDVQTGSESLREAHYGGLIDRRDTASPNGTASLIIRNIPGPGGTFVTRRGPASDWIYQFSEFRGNRFFTSDTGKFVQSVDYQPYGASQSTGADAGSTDYSDFQWNGGELLTPFGLTQLGRRIYDPAIGRFLSRDPLRNSNTAVSANPYAFAANDPWNAADPSGMDCNGNYGQECQYLDTLTPFGLVIGLLQALGGSSSAPPPPAAPKVSTGPQTAAGQALMAASISELGFAPKNFNFDTFAATGISTEDALETIKETPSAERDAWIDQHNAKLDLWAARVQAAGFAVAAVAGGGILLCEATSAVLLSRGMFFAAARIGGSTVSAALGGGGAVVSANQVQNALDDIDELETTAVSGPPVIQAKPGEGGGGYFVGSTNASGGQVWTSVGKINLNDVRAVVNETYRGGNINILTGVHGGENGATEVAEDFFVKEDEPEFQNVPGIRVYNMPSMTDADITRKLQSPDITIGAFCNSGKCLTPFGN